ncbi:MAG TPA: hypothetical protein VFU81_22910 [Thermomicrobiales bacterium]|nr:hypothetical protein [Thermomicrobiales bacterium]
MAPSAFAACFLATAGAGAGFIGLLFVALSLHLQQTFQPKRDGVPRQLLTEAILVSLGNGFGLSVLALLPTLNVGGFAVGLGIWGMLWAGRLAQLFARAHRHGAPAWRHELRVTSLSVAAVALYALQTGTGAVLLRQPAAPGAWTALVLIILGVYARGMARAWIVLGDPRSGWSGRLNPFADDGEPSDGVVAAADGSACPSP